MLNWLRRCYQSCLEQKYSVSWILLILFMMALSKESSYLTTFATMFCRHRYVHVPMGPNLSSDCFQYKIEQIFGPIPQCCGITNDLVIYGYSKEDHNQVLFHVLDTSKHVGLRFNPDKCIFKCTQIPFFGMLKGADGIRLDPKKIEALSCLPLPGNFREMQLFLGIVNHLNRFSPKIANLTGSLRPLVKKEAYTKLKNTKK